MCEESSFAVRWHTLMFHELGCGCWRQFGAEGYNFTPHPLLLSSVEKCPTPSGCEPGSTWVGFHPAAKMRITLDGIFSLFTDHHILLYLLLNPPFKDYKQ